MKSPHKNSILIAIAAATLVIAALAQTQPLATASPAAAAPAAQTASRRPKIVSTVIDTNTLKVTPTASGSRRDVFNGPTDTLNNLESHITTVNPGQEAHPPHTHGNEEMLIVKEGTLDVTIKGQIYHAIPGSIIFYSSNDLHGTHNNGTVPVTYYVFAWITDKTPKTIPASPAATAEVMQATAK